MQTHSRSRSLLFAVLLSCLFLVGCRKTEAPKFETENARDAATLSVRFLRSALLLERPSSPIGVYAALFLLQSGFLPVFSAREGVAAQAKLHGPASPIASEDTFHLLEEFGGVLQVDIPDILNQSTDRPGTLTEYTKGLQNITLRAKRRAEELEAAEERLRIAEREANAQVNTIERAIRDALRAHDYATAGARHKELVEAQSSLAGIQSERKQTRDVSEVYGDLMALAEERLEAIESNREILISGLTVVDVPGIEDLDLIRQRSRGTRRSQTTPSNFAPL